MTRQDFIFTLFDNGNGLSLEQIAEIEKGLIDTIPSGTIEDLQDMNGMSREDATATALMTADEYMQWEDESMIEPYTTRFNKSELATYNRNKKYIEKNAQLMTVKELEKFKAIDRLTAKTA